MIKAILLIDNAPSHPSELKSGDIIFYSLPANVTSLIQPLDQGAIETFKQHYRGLFLQIILQDCETRDMNEALKLVNMKHGVQELGKKFRIKSCKNTGENYTTG